MTLYFLKNELRKIIKTAILTTSLLIYSCIVNGQNTYVEDSHNTVISGIIPDTIKFVDVVNDDYSRFRDLRIPSWNTRTQIPVENGKFAYKVKIEHPIYVHFFCISPNFRAFNGRGSSSFVTNGFLVEPGDSIVFDARIHGVQIVEYPDLKFSGKGAEKHWCIQEIIRNTDLYRYPASIKYYGASPNEQLALSDSIAKMVSQTVGIFKHKLSSAASSLIKAHYINALADDVSDVFIRSGLYLSKSGVKKKYQQELAQRNKLFNANDENLIYGSDKMGIPILQRALLDFSMSKGIEYPLTQFGTHELRRGERQVFKAEYYWEAAKRIPNGILKDKVLSDFIGYVINNFGIDSEVRKMISEYLASTNSKSSFFTGIKKLSMDFGSLMGAKAFPFELPDTTGKVHRQRDFAGKVVLIDFMFNACGGCQAMVPSLSVVEEHYRDNKSVSFISVSIDKEVEGQFGWKSGIGKSSVASSLQLNLLQGGNSPMCKYYGVTAYPTLVLIGKNGKVIAARAPDPRYDNGQSLIKLIGEALAAN